MKLQFTYASDAKIRSKARFRDNFKLMAFPEFPFIKVILVNTLAISLLGLAVPLTVQGLINVLISRSLKQPLVMLSLMLLCILSFSGMLQAIQTYTVEILKRRLFVRYGLVLSERLTNYRDDIFRKENSPSLINRYFDTLSMQSSMVTFFVDGFGFFVMFCIGFGMLIFYHPYFLAFAVAMVVFLVINWLLFGPAGVRAGSPEADGKYNLVGWIEELSRVRNMFSSASGREFSNNKVTALFNEWLDKRNTLFRCQFRQHIGLQIFSVTTNVTLLFLGGMLVLRQELSMGQLVAAALVVGNITSSIPRLQSYFMSIYDYSTAIDKIAQFYDYPLEEDSHAKAQVITHDIQFRQVHIDPNYNFDFALPAGKRIGINIKSFSAIDVFYDLLMGFIPPERGTILVGGKHQADINVPSLRDDIQLIRRDQFFAGSILENLCGTKKGTYEMLAMQSALEKVGLWENIQKMPDKLHTQIRPNGFPLSRSQILTLQVARAFLTRPRILFVTPDFEQISSYKRPMVFSHLLDPSYPWTLLFFTQRVEEGDFDLRASIDRNGIHPHEDDVNTVLTSAIA